MGKYKFWWYGHFNHLAKKIQKCLVLVSYKWHYNVFCKIQFTNCILPPEVHIHVHVLLLQSQKFPYHWLNLPVFSLSISENNNGKPNVWQVSWFWKIPSHTNQFLLRSVKCPVSLKSVPSVQNLFPLLERPGVPQRSVSVVSLICAFSICVKIQNQAEARSEW